MEKDVLPHALLLVRQQVHSCAPLGQDAAQLAWPALIRFLPLFSTHKFLLVECTKNSDKSWVEEQLTSARLGHSGSLETALLCFVFLFPS
jgi:hypothetical protein